MEIIIESTYQVWMAQAGGWFAPLLLKTKLKTKIYHFKMAAYMHDQLSSLEDDTIFYFDLQSPACIKHGNGGLQFTDLYKTRIMEAVDQGVIIPTGATGNPFFSIDYLVKVLEA